MDWVPLFATGNEDAPRALTREEVQDICNVVPTPFCSDPHTANRVRKDLMSHIEDCIRDIKICPSAIQDLKDAILFQHCKSQTVPGTPVGMTAAEAIGSVLTQATLNTFHKAGTLSSAASGIDIVKSIIYARKNIKHRSCTVYPTDKLSSFEDVLNMRKDIVGSVIKDFVESQEIKSIEDIEFQWWHTLFEIPAAVKKVYRLKLNRKEMYKHAVTPKMIVNALVKNFPENDDGGAPIICAYSPFNVGMIDIFPVFENIIEPLKFKPQIGKINKTQKRKEIFKGDISLSLGDVPEVLETAYLDSFVAPDIEFIKVKGLSGIKKLIPIIREITEVIFKEIKVDEKEFPLYKNYFAGNIGKHWMFYLNTNNMMKNGITVDNINNMIYTIIGADASEAEKAMIFPFDITDTPEYIEEMKKRKNPDYKPIQITPLHIIRLRIKNAKEDIPDGYLLTDEGLIYNEEPLEGDNFLRCKQIKNSAEYVTAHTEGGNLKGMLALPGIDKKLTTSNDMHEINELFGIEACRSFYLQELYNVITNSGSYVHPANAAILAELVCNRGLPLGATYIGISGLNSGHLTKAGLERAGEVFSQDALFSRKEDIRGVSAAVITGTRIPTGSGMCDIVFGDKINEEIFTGEPEKSKLESSQDFIDDLVGEIESLIPGGGFYNNTDEKSVGIDTFNNVRFAKISDKIEELEIDDTEAKETIKKLLANTKVGDSKRSNYVKEDKKIINELEDLFKSEEKSLPKSSAKTENFEDNEDFEELEEELEDEEPEDLPVSNKKSVKRDLPTRKSQKLESIGTRLDAEMFAEDEEPWEEIKKENEQIRKSQKVEMKFEEPKDKNKRVAPTPKRRVAKQADFEDIEDFLN